jgi:cytochrome P450
MDAAAVVQNLTTEEGHGDPYPHYRALLELGPVSELPEGQVVVCGYEAVDRVLHDRSLRVMDADLLDRTWPGWREHPAATLQAGSMVFDSSSGHDRVRRLVNQAFTARRVAALEPDLRELVPRLLDQMAERGEDGRAVDFVAEFAYRLPSAVVGALLAIPERDATWLRARTDQVTVFLEPDAPQRDMSQADAAGAELHAYLEDLIALRRAQPGDDLVSGLVQVRDTDDGRLTDGELVSNLALLLIAGSETTTHLLGTALTLLMDHPRNIAALREGPETALSFVEETLRFDGPVQATLRWTPTGTSVDSVRIPAGGSALILLGAANRDPRRFAHPDVFDPHRPDNRPLTFGAGAYHCLGAALARLEARIALPMILDRFPGIALAGEPVRRDQLVLRGYDVLPVSLTGAFRKEEGTG